MSAPAALEVRDLSIEFGGRDRATRAVDGLSFTVGRGEVVALVGESGCGKSITALSAMRLIRPPGRVAGGEILVDGHDVLALSEREMRAIRGNRVSMIFQEPMTALNPVLTVGRQLAEAFEIHRGLTSSAAHDLSLGMLRSVALSEPERRLRQYPHELSGGMRQRVMIAMAMACRPAVLFADEPTTALDVTIQSQILGLLREQADNTGTGIVLITHDLGVVAEIADRIVVMYAGRKVEEGAARDVLASPCHPYTAGLLDSKPSLEAILAGRAPERLSEIPGMVPVISAELHGCAFADRCPRREAVCARDPRPPLRGDDRLFACHNPLQQDDVAYDG